MSDLRPRNRGSKATQPVARHGQLRHSRAGFTVAKIALSAIAVVLVSTLSVGAIAAVQLKGNIKTVDLVGGKDTPIIAGIIPGVGSYPGGFNFLLAGSDSRAGSGMKGPDSVLNDVTMLVHVAEDQGSATVVSIPRDMIVPIPACPRTDGKGNYSSMTAQAINTTLSYGGLACTVLTVEKLTGLKIQFAGLIQFQGVVQMADAIGGVDVCVNGPMRDAYSGINLPKAGTYTISGDEALAFLRSRHGVGDGSDLGRISSQQVFLSSLMRKIKSDGTLTDISKMYKLAVAATSNMQLSSNLTNLNTMISMAVVLKDIPLNRLTFVQYPSTTGVGGVYLGKVAPVVSTATQLFNKIRADIPFTLDSGTGRGSVADPTAPSASPTPSTSASPAPSASPTPSTSASPTVDAPAAVIPGVLGQTAADYTCTKVNN